MVIATNLINNFNTFIVNYGKGYVLFNRTATYDDYDQESLSVTGSKVGSCLVMPINESRNGDDYQFLQQGLIKIEDLKVFVPSGTIDENDLFCLPTGSYTIIRMFPWDTEGTTIYRKLYIRSSGGYNP